MKLNFSFNSSVFTIKTPCTTSEWPPKYFVAECNTISAPNLIGFCKYGDANVLSTTNNKLCFLANCEKASMSMMFNNGLVGVSIHNIFVFAFINASAALTSLMPVK